MTWIVFPLIQSFPEHFPSYSICHLPMGSTCVTESTNSRRFMYSVIMLFGEHFLNTLKLTTILTEFSFSWFFFLFHRIKHFALAVRISNSIGLDMLERKFELRRVALFASFSISGQRESVIYTWPCMGSALATLNSISQHCVALHLF